MRRPDFFLVGAPKCGTTALYRCLQEHPEIFVPDRKEIHYFGTDLYSPTYVRDREIYLSLFSGARQEQQVGEASVWYLFSKRSAMEIKNFAPSAKIIIMLRNPVDMIYSLHSQHLYDATEDIEDFREALGAEKDRKRGRRLPPNVYATERLFYRDIGKYTEQVQRYVDVFSPEQIKVIIYDDFRDRPLQTYTETFEFLDVDSSFGAAVRLVNSNKRVRSKKVRSLLDNPPHFIRRFSRPLTTTSVRHKLFVAARRLNTSFAPRLSLPLELKQELQAEFASDIDSLSTLLNRDLSRWMQSEKKDLS